MKSFLTLALMFFSYQSMGATHTLNFSEPVTVKKIVFKAPLKMNLLSLYKGLPQDKKLIVKN